MVRENFGEQNMLLLGVFDGHGYEGKKHNLWVVKAKPTGENKLN